MVVPRRLHGIFSIARTHTLASSSGFLGIAHLIWLLLLREYIEARARHIHLFQLNSEFSSSVGARRPAAWMLCDDVSTG